MNPTERIDLAKRYLAAIEGGEGFDTVAAFLSPDIVQEELPNRMVPNGARRDLEAMRDASERGRKVIASQRYIVNSAVAMGDMVAVEFEWIGTLDVAIGDKPAGTQMRARCAHFLTFRGDKIVSQRSYDCFDPW